MILQRQITKEQTEIRCISAITKDNDKKFGEKCGKLLLKVNSRGRAAGEIQCSRCHALYEIKNMVLILKNIGGDK